MLGGAAAVVVVMAVVMERCVGALLARLNPCVPLLIRSGGSIERERERELMLGPLGRD